MNKQFDELTLSAYIDGELDAATMLEVEAFLEKDADARKYVLHVLKTTARLRGVMNEVLHENVPDPLIDAVRSHPVKKGSRTLVRHPSLRIAAAIVLVLLGFGLALFSSPNTNAVMSSVESRSYGVASATLATMRQVGMMLSMGIAMLLFSVFIGRVQITPEFYDLFLDSVNVAFIVFACFCFLGVFASLARGRVR